MRARERAHGCRASLFTTWPSCRPTIRSSTGGRTAPSSSALRHEQRDRAVRRAHPGEVDRLLADRGRDRFDRGPSRRLIGSPGRTRAPMPAADQLKRVTSSRGASAPGRVPRRTNRTGAGAARAISERVGPRPSSRQRSDRPTTSSPAPAAASMMPSRPPSATTGCALMPPYCWTSRLGVAEQARHLRAVLALAGRAEQLQRRARGRGDPGAELERRPVVLGAAEGHDARRPRASAARPAPSRATSTADVAGRLAEHRAHVAARDALAEQRPAPVHQHQGDLVRAAPAGRGRRPGRRTRTRPRAPRCRVRSARAARRPPPRSPPAAAGSRSGGRRGPPRRAAAARACARISSRGGSERASGSASASSCGNAPSDCGATRIDSLGHGERRELRRPTASRASSSSSSTGAPSSLFGSSSLSTGPAMNVVTSAMSTSIANSASEITPFSSARFRTISSVRPRVFISVPITADRRQSKPVRRAAMRRAEQLADHRDGDQHERQQPQLGAVEQADVGPAARCTRRTAAAAA